jgi:predicted ATPase/class 3 adenylate cyclase
MARAMALPAGTVTMLFTDIEGSTRLLEHLGERYADALTEHHRIVRAAVAAHRGHELHTEGDAFFVVFTRAGDAVRAAVAAQRDLAACAWPGGVTVRVRMGLHTGEPRVAGDDYVGMDIHRAARICSAAHGGQVVTSEATERILAGEPVEGVGLQGLGEHRLKDLSHPVRLYQVHAKGLIAAFPPLQAIERPPKNEPGQWAAPTALFGREADVAELARLVRGPRGRLVTLVGPGGVGKTRLAIAAATRLAADFADGAHFVALAFVFELRELASAMARALAVPIREGEAADSAVLRFLADRHLLLVLDNFEQLVEAAALVGELLPACSGLNVMVTSREPTRLAAERLFVVRPLEVPDASVRPSPIELERYDAVAMFVDRAGARDPDFALDEANAPHVREICQRLDGLPLALELAAARVGLLSPAELATRLDHALGVLTGGARDVPDRQRTLRATIDWSHGLLTDTERDAFARFAAFRAGATVSAAELVTAAPLDTLDSLVAKQLLVRREDRLLTLETVREYAAERLAEHTDADATYNRLASWCGDLAREATPHLVRADRTPWLAKLDREYPNALAALSWALDSGRAELALQLVGSLGDYWWHGHRWEDGLVWIEMALERTHGASGPARAKLLLYRARLTGMRRNQARCHRDLQDSLEVFRACDDAAGTAACLGHLAVAATWTGDFEHARALADEAVRSAERSQDEAERAFVLTANVIATKEYAELVARAPSAVEFLRATGNLLYATWICNTVAFAALARGRYEDALRWLVEALETARPLEDPHAVFIIRGNEGLARVFLHQLDAAAVAFRAGFAVCHEAADEDIVDEPLLGLAAVAALQGEFPLAARLAGAARAYETGRSLEEDSIWSRLTDLLGPARDRYGPEKWDRAEREGAALTTHDAINLALERGRFAPAATTTTPAAPS